MPWAGQVTLVFAKTAGTCDALGDLSYNVDIQEFELFSCEIRARQVTTCTVEESLACVYQTGELTLQMDLHLERTYSLWAGSADVSAQTAEMECTGRYHVLVH